MTKAEKTRQFIIERTASVFNKKGFAGTSLTDITLATGLTKGSIYGNFENKDEVAFAVFDYNIKRVNAVLEAAMAEHDSVKGKLLAYVNVYASLDRSRFPEGGCPMLNTAVEADDTHPQLKKKAAKAVLTWKNNIQNLLQKGIDTKEIKADIDPEQFALTLIATIEGMIMIANLIHKPANAKMIIASVENSIRALF